MRMKVDLQFKAILILVALTLLLQPAASAGQRLDSTSGQPVAQPAQTGEAAQSSASHSGNVVSGSAQPLEDQLPDSPGALQPRTGGAVPPSGQQVAQTTQQQQPNRPHEPVGTAAAEWVPAVGVAASRPAGAALAPAKQRRARSILIKVGAILGAGAAVGTVMALSEGSPSKPPGSH